MTCPSDPVTYPLRRLFWWVADYNLACRAKWCARPWAHQGLLASIWCARHNTRIMAGESTKGWV